MKTRNGLFILLCLFFSINLKAQTIIGNTEVCLFDCSFLYVIDANGIEITDDLIWDLGNGATTTGPNAFFCPDFEGAFLITVAVLCLVLFLEQSGNRG